MRSVYPSDISREKFKIILPDLESCRKKQSQEDLICMMYLVECCTSSKAVASGAQEFPKWRSCYDYFKKWEDKESILESVLKN